jgi:uncharacterized membrane protein
MLRTVLSASIILITLSGFSNHASAQSWQICNKTSQSVEIAVGYAVSGGALQSEGWWTLAPNGCQKVMSRSEAADYTRGYLYAKAASSGRSVVAGDQDLCVKNSAFTIRGHRNCEGRNYRTVRSREIAINLNKNFTTSITGSGSGSASGATKFDD